MTNIRTAMVAVTSATTDLRGIRLGRAPWEPLLTMPDRRPETAPRRSSIRPILPRLSANERVELLKRAIAEVAVEERDHG